MDARSLWRHLAALGAAWGGLLSGVLSAQTSHTIAVVTLANDPRFAPRQVEKAYPGHPRGSVMAAVKLGIDDAQFELNEARLTLVAREYSVASLDKVAETVERIKRDGAQFIIVDAPEAFFASLVPTAQSQAVVFNVGSASDELRATYCAGTLFHTFPSTAMQTDAIAQFLAARSWREVLVVHGANDTGLVRAWARSAKRSGLRIVDTRAFKLSTDPREREVAQPRLLTNARNYDVVVVWDSEGEFARSLPYNTQLPRPVVGSNGLVAAAWHPLWDRFGAPQLSRRFARAAGRPMTGQDWAGWTAVKAIVNVLIDHPRASTAKRIEVMRSAQFSVDGFKGQRLTFRPWDGQLRQPILMSHVDGVLGLAPTEGALHPVDALDTLGVDEAESPCKRK